MSYDSDPSNSGKKLFTDAIELEDTGYAWNGMDDIENDDTQVSHFMEGLSDSSDLELPDLAHSDNNNDNDNNDESRTDSGHNGQTPFWSSAEPMKSVNLESLVNLVKTVNSTIFTDPYQSTPGDDTEKTSGPVKSLIYEDGSSIDWIHEYALERIRISRLRALPGLHGRLHRLWDSSEVWIVVVGTGITVGVLASMLNIVTPWLADIKIGHCSQANYLSRAFCCWGGSSGQCNWKPWTSSPGVGSYIIYTVASVILATAAALLIRIAPQARFSGIPEIKAILGGYFVHDFMGTRTLLVKIIGLTLVGGAGLWVGKEGPLVHVACCCSTLLLNQFSSLRNNEAKKREIYSSAAAAGISVALGAPIGGVLFSLEQLSYYFPSRTMWHSFVCAMVASVTLQMIDPFRTGKMGLFQVVYDRTWYDFEFIPFVLLGILGGLYGGAFPVLNMMYARARKSSKPMMSESTNPYISKLTRAIAYVLASPVLEVAILGLITALINYPNVFMRGQTTSLLASLFQECPTSSSSSSSSSSPLAVQSSISSLLCGEDETSNIILLLTSSLIAFLLTTYSFGTAIPAGMLMPSMAIGGMTGRALGMIVDSFHRAYPMSPVFRSCATAVDGGARCVTPGVYAVVGAASALGGLTRMTVSIVIIMFELTGALYYVLPIMCGVMIAKWVADSFGKRGIYETWIMFCEYPYLPAHDDTPVGVVEMKELFTRLDDLVVIRESQGETTDDLQQPLTIDLLQNLITTSTVKGFPVITHDHTLVGFISRAQLRFALDTAGLARGLPPNTVCYFDKPSVIEEPVTTPLLDLSAYLDPTLFTLSEHATLPLVADTISSMGLRYLLFTNPRGQLMGMTTKRDVWRLINSDMSDLVGRDVRVDNSMEYGAEEERGLLDLEELL